MLLSIGLDICQHSTTYKPSNAVENRKTTFFPADVFKQALTQIAQEA